MPARQAPSLKWLSSASTPLTILKWFLSTPLLPARIGPVVMVQHLASNDLRCAHSGKRFVHIVSPSLSSKNEEYPCVHKCKRISIQTQIVL